MTPTPPKDAGDEEAARAAVVRALEALYLEVDERIADDVSNKFVRYVAAVKRSRAQAEERAEELEELRGIVSRTEFRATLEQQAKAEQELNTYREALERIGGNELGGWSREIARTALAKHRGGR